MKEIALDMDGTIANLYGVENWLEYLIKEDTYPYFAAAPMVNLSRLARYIHKLQRDGYQVGIISWLSKSGSPQYNDEVAATKLEWLQKHLPSVEFDYIHIINYGTPKSTCGHGILFDDEEPNRREWEEKGNRAYSPDEIWEVLRSL